MSVWATKSFGRDRDYIVIKHTLRGVNNIVLGVKFRDGYAVVEKGSKTHLQLKKMPLLSNAQEYPITFLRKLKFITRTTDIKLVYGQEVYSKYLQELSKAPQVQAVQAEPVAALPQVDSCKFTTKRGTPCKYTAMSESPSGYCTLHILKDSGLAALGIEVPQFIEMSKREEVIDGVIKKLKSGKFKAESNG